MLLSPASFYFPLIPELAGANVEPGLYGWALPWMVSGKDYTNELKCSICCYRSGFLWGSLSLSLLIIDCPGNSFTLPAKFRALPYLFFACCSFKLRNYMVPWWAFVGDCCGYGNDLVRSGLIMCLIGCYPAEVCLLMCISSRAGLAARSWLPKALASLLLRDLFIEAFLSANLTLNDIPSCCFCGGSTNFGYLMSSTAFKSDGRPLDLMKSFSSAIISNNFNSLYSKLGSNVMSTF